MKAWQATLLTTASILLGCVDSPLLTRNNLDSPGSGTLTCLPNGEAKPLSECAETGQNYRLYVIQNFRSTLAAIDIDSGSMLDLDPFTPTANGIKLPGQAHDIKTAPNGKALYAIASPKLLLRIDIPEHEITQIDLPISAKKIVVSPALCASEEDCAEISGDGGLFLLSTDGNELLRFPFVDGDSLFSPPNKLPTPPEALSDIDVGHGRLVGTTADGARIATLAFSDDGQPADEWTYFSINPECSDGRDNDGDGLLDGHDPDCKGANDTNEGTSTDFACGNGTDDDNDGLIDMEDPGCARSDDNSEWSEANPCNDGIDNDGDGCTDPPSGEGCDGLDIASGCESLGGLLFETATCADEIDNDGDGLTDGDDESCKDGGAELPHPAPCENGRDENGNGLFDAPTDPVCAEASSISEHKPACSDGLDNDGDSLTDEEDSDCYGPYGDSEQARSQSSHVLVRLNPEEAIAYILRPVERDIVALKLDDGAIIENHQDFPLWGQGEFADTPLSGLPVGMVFTRAEPDPNDGEVAPEGESTMLKAYVGTRSGRVTHYDPYNHRPKPLGEDPEAFINQPALSVNDQSVDIRYALPEGVPHLGRFTVDEDSRNFYGITLTADPQNVPPEFWTVSSGAILPETESYSGRILESNQSFHDPSARFCSAGVEPGDILEILPGSTISCGELQGTSFRARIEAVSGETLVFDPSTIQAATEEADSVPSFISTEAALSPNCLAGPLHYRVRVAPEIFLVEGQKTGILNPWTEAESGECKKTTEDPKWSSRARIGTLKADVEAQSCPITTDDPAVEPAVFENPLFKFSITPACALESFRPTYPEPFEGVVYRFSTTSEWNQSTLMTASSGSSLIAAPESGPVLFIDPSSEAIYLIDPKLNSISKQLN